MSKSGYLGVARAAVSPVRVAAEGDVRGVGADEHVVELTRARAEFGVVHVVGERQASVGEGGAEAVQGGGLHAELGVRLVLGSAPLDRARVRHDDLGARLFRPLRNRQDVRNARLGLVLLVQRAVDVDRAHRQAVLLQERRHPVDLVGRGGVRLEAVQPARRHLGEASVEVVAEVAPFAPEVDRPRVLVAREVRLGPDGRLR